MTGFFFYSEEYKKFSKKRKELIGIIGEKCYFQFAGGTVSGNSLSGSIQHTECIAQGTGLFNEGHCYLFLAFIVKKTGRYLLNQAELGL